VLLLGLLISGSLYAVFSPAQADSQASETEQVAKGKELFIASCSFCHGQNGEGVPTVRDGYQLGPSLVGVGAAAVDFQVGTGRMPMASPGQQAPRKQVAFNDEEVAALAAYVASLGPGPDIPADHLVNGGGDAANGAELFRINCAMCHNVAGAGGALTEGKFAPPLTEVTGVHIYEAMVTGPQNMPVFNDLNISPEDKRDIITYLKYVQDNRSPGGFELGSLGPVSEGLFIWIFGLGTIVAITVWITAKSN